MFKRPNKYNYKSVEIDGHKFPSTKEGNHYLYLKKLQQEGKIEKLELQPKFDLFVNGIKVAPRAYRADFAYFDKENGKQVIVEVKGFDTREGKLRRRLAEAVHGITIELV